MPSVDWKFVHPYIHTTNTNLYLPYDEIQIGTFEEQYKKL